jgi:hypothetical protein
MRQKSPLNLKFMEVKFLRLDDQSYKATRSHNPQLSSSTVQQ